MQWICLHQLARRNLTASQKAVLALEIEKILAVEAKERKLATLKKGQEKPDSARMRYRDSEKAKGKASEHAAEMMQVSPRYIEVAKNIQEHAPELLADVKQGKLSLSQAKQVATVPKEQRQEAIARVKRGEAAQEGGMVFWDGKLIPVETNKEVELYLDRIHGVCTAVKALRLR